MYRPSRSSLISLSLLLWLATTASALEQQKEVIVERKEAYIPAGSGQRPWDVTRHTISLNEIQSGGPPKNGIPALDHPAFMSVSEADRTLKPQDMVLGTEFSGVSKAYPVRILNWHEVVNDDVGDQPVIISWCPLCGSALVFDPRVNEHRYVFGVSGLLYQQNLLLFDHETDSLWSQLGGKAVAGPLAGADLRLLPAGVATWQSWKAEHPQTLVLSFETGFKRDYGRDPYREWPLDRRMVLVISSQGQTKIYPYSELQKAKAPVHGEVGGVSFTILFDGKEQSASVQSSSGAVPPHFTAFLGNVRAFFPHAEIYKAR